jgi:hypothetical protein
MKVNDFVTVPGNFIPGGIPLFNLGTGDWLNPGTSLDVLEKRKTLTPFEIRKSYRESLSVVTTLVAISRLH